MNERLCLSFALLAALAISDVHPVTKGTPKKPFQPWVKKGRIIAPGFAGPQSLGRVAAPSVVRLKNGRLRMYFWTTGRGHQYIYAAEANPSRPYDWKLLSDDPVLGPSPTGNINDKGPSFPCVVPRDDGSWLMYYVTWGSWAPPDELSNRTALAISNDDGIHWKVLREPLLPLGKPGECDAGITGSVAVLKTDRTYQMWYTAGERYAVLDWIRPGFKRGIVHIAHASSRDGIEWIKDQKPVLSPRLDAVPSYEAVVSKPAVVLINGIYHMWLSVFTMQDGGGYRLNYARSTDGLHWERFANEEILPLTPGDFDSEHQSYADVIEQGDELWMFYVGNTFGSTGIGLTTMKKSALQ